MVKPIRAAIVASAIILFTSRDSSVLAQSVAAVKTTAISDDSLRRGIIKAVTNKLKRSHYSPKAIDDSFSVNVWGRFLSVLDPYNNIFLQKDINELGKYKLQVDDQLNSSSDLFFNMAWEIFSIRAKEVSSLCEQILSHPLDLNKKGVYEIDRKDSEYPATIAGRQRLWSDFLRYSVLKNYSEIESAGVNGKQTDQKADANIEIKAREKVARWYKAYFTALTRGNAVNEKFSSFVNTVTLEMDPHTMYTFPKTEDKLNAALTKKYYGIGVELNVSASTPSVKRIITGGAAYKSGQIKENDIILAFSQADGKMISTLDIIPEETSNYIRGEKGSLITLIVKQPGEAERTVTLIRDEVRDNSNNAKSAVVVINGKRIGYIYLPLFYMGGGNASSASGCAQDVSDEVEKLKDQKVEGIVFDLRGNGGGSLTEVVNMTSSFMPPGLISQLRVKDTIKQYRSSPGIKSPYDGPLVVLIDELSASASEIFTAAMQDYGRAVIIGTSSSFGKGTAQEPVIMGKVGDEAKGIPDISYGSMRLTTQKFYRVNGTTTQLAGVKPDVVLTDFNNIQVVNEKEMHAALPADTIGSAFVPMDMPHQDYTRSILMARQRIQKNTGLQQLNEQMKVLKQLEKEPIQLDLAGYKHQREKVTTYEKSIRDIKELKGDSLQILPSVYISRGHELSIRNAQDEAVYQQWLKKLSKDLFLSEAVFLVQDMIINSAK